MFNRDSKKQFEINKFMIPDPYLMGERNLALGDSWGSFIEII